MGTAIKHPVPDRVKLCFVIFDIGHSDILLTNGIELFFEVKDLAF